MCEKRHEIENCEAEQREQKTIVRCFFCKSVPDSVVTHR